jgi:hypothetical protein
VINNKAAYSQPFSTLKIEPSTPILWMAAPESYFLRAEGALRGWNMGGTAKSLYELGIQASFNYWGAGSSTNYAANNTLRPAAYTDISSSGNNIGATSSSLSTITVLYNDADPFETRLEKIITQKWIAMYPDGQEAWSEFRRTRYPKVFPVVSNQSGGTINTTTQIRRLPFPQTEYQSNAAGVATGITFLSGQDNGGTKLWWDKKP